MTTRTPQELADELRIVADGAFEGGNYHPVSITHAFAQELLAALEAASTPTEPIAPGASVPEPDFEKLACAIGFEHDEEWSETERSYGGGGLKVCREKLIEIIRTLAERMYRLGQRSAAPQWRPISEAPKDGTLILVWDGHTRIGTTYASPDLRRNDYTHFMPLPSPPAAQTREGE